MITTQTVLDYADMAQQRVCADTRVLVKKATLTLPAAASSVALPAEAIRIEALYNGTLRPEQVGPLDYLRLASGQAVETTSAAQSWYTVIGRSLYVWPGGSSTSQAITIVYSYRAATMQADSEFEVTGLAEQLVQRLAEAYALLDDGQPELAQQEIANYSQDAARLRARVRRGDGRGGQLRLAGRRRRTL